jgi:hypothetical protein
MSGGWSSWPVRLRCRPPRCAPGSTGAGSRPASTPSRPAAGSSGPTRPNSASCGSVVGGLRDTTHVAGGCPRNRSHRHAKASKERALCHASTTQATTSTCMWAVCLAHLDCPPGRIALHQLGRGRVKVGGDQGQVEAGGVAVLAGQHDLHGTGAVHVVPQAGDRREVDGGGLAVAGARLPAARWWLEGRRGAPGWAAGRLCGGVGPAGRAGGRLGARAGRRHGAGGWSG